MLLAISFTGFASPITSFTIVRHIKVDNERQPMNSYYYQVLKLALNKTIPTHGPYHLQETTLDMNQSRAMSNLTKGNLIDVVWTMTSRENEVYALPVRIPLLKGLLGYRVLMIRKDREKDFSEIRTLEDLRLFTAGLGNDWSDNSIFEANQLPVIKGSQYSGLFKMLKAKRFDYFPLGLAEALYELDQTGDDELTLEDHVILKYIAPAYFFVNHRNSELAKRIEAGLLKAIDDGSFDELFYNHALIKPVFEKSRILSRLVIELNNPQLHPQTPVKNARFWFQSPILSQKELPLKSNTVSVIPAPRTP
ncbi:hypothetical protein TDB9533_01089 [Thalassocella blandensis]|nr:hypothetical protein TDB9533_01089 [Thalassocella blandensis]